MMAAEPRQISLEEVQEHHTDKSVWMIIHNKVYDVTKFLGEHPGGEAVLMECAGQDATEPFEDAGHSDDARTMLKDYFVGDLREEDCGKTATPPTKVTCPTGGPLSGYEFQWPHLLIPVGVVLAAALIVRYYWSASAARKV